MMQGTLVRCGDDTCVHNVDNYCCLKLIETEVQEGEIISNGKRAMYVSCMNYKDRRTEDECD